MKYFPVFFLLILISACNNQKPLIRQGSGELLASIAFGSCNKQDQPQVLWDDIANEEADFWIWLGDNIYGDTPDPAIMKAKYDQQKSNTKYQKFLLKNQVYGVWDDHDYGINNGGKEFAPKDTMRNLMFDFLDVPKSNPAWGRKGAYQSYDLTNGAFKIKLILLDSRYFRDEAPKSGGLYIPNLTGTVLGEDQWLWLEGELAHLESDLLIIANGIQVLPEEHKYEKWANFPNERKRLLQLLSGESLPKTILLSGDRHHTEVSKIQMERVIYEVTCSGMTHTRGLIEESNQHRIGDVVAEKNYGSLKVYEINGVVKIFFEAKGDNSVVHDRVELVY